MSLSYSVKHSDRYYLIKHQASNDTVLFSDIYPDTLICICQKLNRNDDYQEKNALAEFSSLRNNQTIINILNT